MIINNLENVKNIYDFMQNQLFEEETQGQMFGVLEKTLSGILTAGLIFYAIVFICIFVLPVCIISFFIYKHIAYNKKVKLELARHGIVPPAATSKLTSDKNIMQRNAYLSVGIAIGIIIGIIILQLKDFDTITKFLILFSSTMLFFGFSYLTFLKSIKGKKLDNDTDN
jgi:hypothetical protein